ncbi:MAG TPA: GspE/PulE family protein, partial [Candidatus Cloacimonadota bacterium]|nr:GspE/PulE family protein [Candidatus Cloacimonadota bacterium]
VVQELIERVTQPVSTLLEITEESPQIIETHPAEMEVDEQAVDDEINKSMLVNLFDSILVDAVRNDASDIHIIPVGKNNVELYLRIDGRLKLWYKQENASPESIAAVIKDRSVGVDRFERDTAQDGYAQRLIDDHLIRFRISILPIVSAEFERRFESIVIRVIDDRKVISDFRKLGFQKQAEEEFFKAINTSKGIVIVTGPTGSGKSTTLMAALNHIINPALNVLTCEDPVEYVIKGARQLKIGHKMSFEQAVRSILRHDPDVVMVGEIRDKITADIAVKLANTGHLTLSTLHTNDAPSAITRLYKMGVEPFLLAYSINIIIAQRLVRKLCDKCKRPIGEDQYLAAESMGFTQEEIHSGIIYRPVGCKNCQDGYKGRINIAEALYFYPEIRTEIIRSSSEIDEEHIRSIAEKRGMLSMRASGMDRIRAGLTSIAEVLYATAEE